MKVKGPLLLVLMVAGCAAPEPPKVDDESRVDAAATGPDLANRDDDLADPADLSSSADQTVENPRLDLGVDAALPDLASPDLAAHPQVDLAAPPVDLAPRDQAAPPDLLRPADMVVVPVCTPPVAAGICDTSPQCGCTGGQGCSVTNTTTGATSCVAVGTTKDYSGCTGTGAGQCKAGSTCVDGVCQPYCQTAADCPGTFRECSQVQNAAGTAIPGFTTCTQLCDPVTPARTDATYGGCGPNIGCLPGSNRVTSCFGPTTGSALQDDPCGDSIFSPTNPDFTQCAPGYLCLTTTLFGTNIFSCAKFCHRSTGDADCAPLNGSGTTYHCNPFATKQYAGTEEIGYCY